MLLLASSVFYKKTKFLTNIFFSLNLKFTLLFIFERTDLLVTLVVLYGVKINLSVAHSSHQNLLLFVEHATLDFNLNIQSPDDRISSFVVKDDLVFFNKNEYIECL